jgi:outer membrane protein
MRWQCICRVGANSFSEIGRVIAVLSLLLSFASVSVAAEDLLELYTQALTSDPRFSSARFEHDATLEKLKIARAGLLPKIYAEGTYTQTQQDIVSSDNSVYGNGTSTFPTTAQTLSLTQPLFNIATLANFSRAKAEVKGADLQMEAAKQDLAVRLAKAYLGVLASRDNSAFLHAEEAAVGMYHDLVRSKFDSGLAPKTDYLDAKARIAEVRANKIAAENNLDDALQSLREIAGRGTAGIARLREEIPLISPDPNDIDAWSDSALKHNPALGLQRQIVEASRHEVSRQEAGHYPYLNLEANYNRTKTEGTLFGGGSDVKTTYALLRLNIPIFEGGLVRARTREALNLHKAALQEEERQRRALVKEARAAYQGIGSAVDRVQALREAVESQKLALEAKREGYKSGLLAFRAVLDAERDLYRARRDHAIARYDYVMNCLRLKKAAGILNVSDIAAVNDWLE